MRALMGITCVMGLAVGSVYLWKEYSAYSDRQKIADAKTYLFNRADAKTGDIDRVKLYCAAVDRLPATHVAENPFLHDDHLYCRAFGYL